MPNNPATNTIAFIGGLPTSGDIDTGYAFSCDQSQFLFRILAGLGINPVDHYFNYLYPYRAKHPGDVKSNLFAETRVQIAEDLTKLKPNLVVTLGDYVFSKIKPDESIEGWRGSITQNDFFGFPIKTISTFTVDEIYKRWELFPLFKFDLKRSIEEARTKELSLPQIERFVNLPANQICQILDTWPSGLKCSIDIEGGLPEHRVNEAVKADSKKRRYIGWRCVAVAGRTTRAFAIVWSFHSVPDQVKLFRSLKRLLERKDVPKVLQNSLYENFVLPYGYGILVDPVVEDTMLKGWELNCELPKGLSTQASIFTRHPHWKNDDMYDSNLQSLAEGCCTDAAVTLEISQVQEHEFSAHPKMYAHYRANMDILKPIQYMELRGIRYDSDAAKLSYAETMDEMVPIGNRLCELAGTELRGEKGSLSARRLQKALYETLKFPPQYKKEGFRKSDKLTSDVEALLNLKSKFPDSEFIRLVLRHRHLESCAETLSIKPDADGRVRCGYNAVGTETGRLTCYTSPTGAGANLTTITKKFRKHYLADPYYDFFQCDLSGADGWTVAAHCKRLGDPTMLEDYYKKRKPAKLICLMYAFGNVLPSLDDESIDFWHSDRVFSRITNNIGSWVYDGSKAVQHGTNYKMGVNTVSSTLLKQSYKKSGTPVYLPVAEGRVLQNLYKARYTGLETWHNWSKLHLERTGTLESANGHVRQFFGRRFGQGLEDTLRQYLSDEPQNNTTWATNLAVLRCWDDLDNRVKAVTDLGIYTCGRSWLPFNNWPGDRRRFVPGALIIEPLHQVHDAFCGQWPQFARDWAKPKINKYFDNTLTIGGTNIVIPFEGNYGPSWGQQSHNI